MKLFRKLSAYLIITGFLFSCTGSAPVLAKSVSKLQQKLDKSSRHMESIRGKLRTIKGKQKKAKTNLLKADREYASYRRNLLNVRHRLRNTKASLKATISSIAEIEKRLKQRNDLLANRLVDIYKHGNFSYIEVLLDSADFSDMLDRGYIVKKIIQSDTNLLNAIKEDKQELEDQKGILEFQLAQRVVLEYQQTALTQDAFNAKKDRSKVLESVDKQRERYEIMLAMEMKNSKEIKSIILKESKTTKGRKRQNTVWSGSFIRPVSGSITSNFGMRHHPILKKWKKHTGVDISASTGTSIKAADSGEVIYAGWLGAYGNAIIIDHGGGMQTVYAHCSKLLVKKGRKVSKGKIIGRVGSTGWSTGPHLHFEVRKNGNPINPLK